MEKSDCIFFHLVTATGFEGMHDSYSSLTKWIRSHGGYVHKALSLKGAGTNRGIFAESSLSAGDKLVSIPARLSINGSELGTSYGDKRASNWLRCIAAFYKAQGGSKFYQPYLDSLPQDYESLLNWSDAEVASYLSGTTIGKQLAEDRMSKVFETQYKSAVRPYLVHVGALQENDMVSSQETNQFQQACMCVATRGFHLHDTHDYSGPYLLPWIDLLNHDPVEKCTTLQWDSGYFTMVADRDIEAGEEIRHSYGSDLTSAQLLKTFGFVTERAVNHVLSGTAGRETTPAVISKQEIVFASRHVSFSRFPAMIQDYMKNQLMADEHWELNDFEDRDLSFLPDEFLIKPEDPLSDELITICAALLIPQDAYEEIVDSLVDRSILDDYYLGKLICSTLLHVVRAKFTTYKSTKDNDATILRQSLETNCPRAVYGLTVRLEERRCLSNLLAEVDVVNDTLGGIILQDENDNVSGQGEIREEPHQKKHRTNK
jgi:hypothetical protein